MTYVDDPTWRLLQFARFAEKGSWPVAGGVLDQTQAFLDACDFIWSEERRQKAERGIPLTL